MTSPKFIISKNKILEQVGNLKELGLKVSYSYKTNRDVGDLLQEISDVDFSVHAFEEIEMFKDKSRIWFFTQAESEKELEELLSLGIKNFVIDNEVDLERMLKVLEKTKCKINVSLRMKFSEHRIGTGKYFVYGMSSRKVNELILKLGENKNIGKLGIHIHRKSQNTSEWELLGELKDSLIPEVLGKIKIVNLGGGLPSVYRSSTYDVFPYIFSKIKEAVDWLAEKGIETYIEPGRFVAAPSVKLETEIVQVYENNIVVNVSIYNCALDTVLTHTKMLVEGELGENEVGENFLIKGNSPTRDDIFRYRVKLNPEKVKVGEKIVFLNAGAYNYATDFFGYKKVGFEVGDYHNFYK